eukprot:TRINITY_DN532_c0_g1_i4.p1 TRINITY_DN532_c0_g1~~TRINITY_DN532_c0_g1_i4.p1  ORF type:complete len:356 (-),score=192.31 TRINITY_DN532_c0_g1_i4:207-1202(-)
MSEPVAAESTSSSSSAVDMVKLKEQIEFYFDDSNYPKDKFLRAKAGENDGWVPISVLTTFSRTKAFTEDVSVIADSVSSSEVVEVSEDKTKLKRKNPLPAEDTTPTRTLVVSGFQPEAVLDQIKEYFTAHGKVNQVRMKRDKHKNFTGVAFVEFSQEAEAKSALAGELVFGESPLKAVLKADFIKETQQKKAEKRDRDAPKEERKREVVPGLIVKYTGITVPELERDVIRALFQEHAEVQYVDYQKGAAEGYARFSTAEDAKKVIEAINAAEKKIGEDIIKTSLVEGEEEQAYWTNVWSFMDSSRSKRGGKGGRGGRGGGRGGRPQKRHRQ